MTTDEPLHRRSDCSECDCTHSVHEARADALREADIAVLAIRPVHFIHGLGDVVARSAVRAILAEHQPWSEPTTEAGRRLLCPDCGHHIHRPQPCGWTFGPGPDGPARPCPCPEARADALDALILADSLAKAVADNRSGHVLEELATLYRRARAILAERQP